MQSNRSRDTGPELRLRSELHSRGLRYFVDRAPTANLRRRADVVFPRKRVAVFIDGCFWHGCPEHFTIARTNAEYWAEQVERNRARDLDTNARLAAERWTVVRVWEHEEISTAADRVEAALRTHW